MPWLAITVILTLGISFFCSLFEAVILSTTVAEIEELKKSRPRRGLAMESLKLRIDDTISSILTLNTIANGLGSAAIGAMAVRRFSGGGLVAATLCFGAFLLIGSEVLPKNLGVAHRRRLLPIVAYPMVGLRRTLAPVSWLCNLVLRPFVGAPPQLHGSGEEIILLAQRGAQQGTLSASESSIIANALSLDDVRVSAIMTPRTVVTALSRTAAVAGILKDFPSLPFGRMPVYGRNLDDIVGVIRRVDLLNAKAAGRDAALVEELMHEVTFIPETVTVANALQVFLRKHQKLLVAVDEFGATAGVITMEDVIECLLGREIFEKDDIAVDMREFARSRTKKQARAGTAS